MKKLILIVFLLIPLVVNAQLFGKAKSKDVDDILVIEADKKGMYVITPKSPLVIILDTEESRIYIQYGASEVPIREMTYTDIEDAVKIIEQLYPDYKCFDNYGLNRCDLKKIFKIED